LTRAEKIFFKPCGKRGFFPIAHDFVHATTVQHACEVLSIEAVW
jgi:hypothetical protein